MENIQSIQRVYIYYNFYTENETKCLWNNNFIPFTPSNEYFLNKILVTISYNDTRKKFVTVSISIENVTCTIKLNVLRFTKMLRLLKGAIIQLIPLL